MTNPVTANASEPAPQRSSLRSHLRFFRPIGSLTLWQRFTFEVAIIVFGVGAALWAEAQLRERNVHAEIDALERAVWVERANSYVFAKERLATADCRRDTIRRLSDALLEGNETEARPWTGQPWSSSGQPTSEGDKARFLLPMVQRLASRPLTTTEWRSRADSELRRYMDPDRVSAHDITSWNIEEFTDLQTRQRREWNKLNVLARDTVLTRAERHRYYDRLALVASDNGLFDLLLEQHIDHEEVFGFSAYRLDDMPPQDELEGSFNDEGPSIYGDCWKPVDLSALYEGGSGNIE